jgi:hypothetical protein
MLMRFVHQAGCAGDGAGRRAAGLAAQARSGERRAPRVEGRESRLGKRASFFLSTLLQGYNGYFALNEVRPS